MKCPILRIGELIGGAPYSTTLSDCLEKECAWWQPFLRQCSIPLIERQIGQTAYLLAKAIEPKK